MVLILVIKEAMHGEIEQEIGENHEIQHKSNIKQP
jgi:hypothetical protein